MRLSHLNALRALESSLRHKSFSGAAEELGTGVGERPLVRGRLEGELEGAGQPGQGRGQEEHPLQHVEGFDREFFFG